MQNMLGLCGISQDYAEIARTTRNQQGQRRIALVHLEGFLLPKKDQN